MTPRLARWLLDKALPAETAEAVIGDLTEGFRERAAVSVFRARVWFWRQTFGSIAASATAGWRDSSANRHGGVGRAGLLSAARQDLRFALRSLRRAPAFSLAAIATLAIGIGASTAIGTAANRTLLRPLPYPTGDRLVFLGHPNDDGSIGNVGFTTVVDWRTRMTSFDEMTIIRGWSPTLESPDGATPLSGMRVNWNFFRLLGVRPAIGRDFEAGDDDPDHSRVVIISDGLWRTRFHAREDIVGVTMEFFGRSFQIIGVLPASYDPLVAEHFFGQVELYAPLGYNLAGDSSCRSCRHLRLLARLSPGATLPQALQQAAAVHADLRRQFPSDYTAAAPVALMLQDEIARPMRLPLQVLLGAVLFVLLVSATNVAGLLMSRAADREREFALRSALGAGWGRLIRQLVTESLVLAIAAGAAGLALARLGLSALAAAAPPGLNNLAEIPADPALLAIAIASTGIALVAFAVLPALFASRPNLEAVLRTARQSASARSLRTREWLMTGQVAIALLLVAGAGLMHRTVDRLLNVDPGFTAANVFTAGLSLVGPAWAQDDPVRAFQTDLLTKVRALPGVDRAALAGQIPLGNNYDRWGFFIEGRTYVSEAEAPEAERYSVTPDYFTAMGIPLRQGRLFTDNDTLAAPLVMIVNDTAARLLWPGENPVGARVHVPDSKGKPRTVVGVVGDVRHYSLGVSAAPQMYLPQAQVTDSYLVLVAHVNRNPGALAQPVRQLITGMSKTIPVYDVATLEERVSRSVTSRMFLMLLLTLFAATTVVMAAVGLYGIVAQGVGARLREFSIRVALGAARRDITWIAARRGFIFVMTGVAIGLAMSAACGTLLRGQLYETTPADPVVLAGAAGALLIVAVVAHLGPLRRAVAVEPARALRSE